MALKAEEISGFYGFGTGVPLRSQFTAPTGEYFYSQGMTKSLFGITPGWSIAKNRDNTDLPTLQLGNFFAQGSVSNTIYTYMVDAAGFIYRSALGVGSYTLEYQPGGATHGNGLFFDQKNRLLYATDRYLGMFDPTLSNYSTGTLAVTNGSNSVVGTGTTFTAAMTGKRILIGTDNAFYTVTFVDATHITLDSNYAGTTASGLSYTIFVAWTDQWKDFGAANISTSLKQMDALEDWVVIPNANNLAIVNVTDDSFNAIALNLPVGYTVAACRSGITGNLSAINFNSRGAVLLWDAQQQRSIAPWIWYNGNVQAVVPVDDGWVVFTTRGIYKTNGYTSVEVITKFPDSRINLATLLNSLLPQGVDVVAGKAIFWGMGNNFNRARSGLWILDLKTNLFEFAPVASQVTYGVTGGAVFYDKNYRIHLSYTTSTPSAKVIGRLDNSNPASAFFISNPIGDGNSQKIAEGAKLTMGLNTIQTERAAQTFSISIKVANLKSSLWNYKQTNGSSSATNKLSVNGTIGSYSGKVGDEVTVIQGVNAGAVRHITAITNSGLSNEEWTLDSAFANLTEASVYLCVSPFKLARKLTLTDATLTELKDYYFDIMNKIRGRHFLVKVLLESMPTNLELEISGGQLIYDDKGTQKGD